MSDFFARHAERLGKWLLALITALVVLSPLIIRIISGQPVVIGEESFYNLRVSHGFFDKPLNDYNILNPYHILLTPFSFLGLFGIIILQLALGLASAFTARKILKKMGFSSEKTYIILAFFVLSPPFIYAYTHLTYHSFSLLLMLLSILFINKLACAENSSRKVKVLASITFLLLGMFSLVHSLFVVFIALVYFISKRDKSKPMAESMQNFYISLFSLVGSGLFFLINQPDKLLFYVEFIKSPGLGFFSDLGAEAGFGIFTMLMLVFGFFSSWRDKEKHYLAYSGLFITLATSIVFERFINIYANIFVSYFAGIGFYEIIKSEWNVKEIKNFTILLVLCGMLFSTISYSKNITLGFPQADLIEAVKHSDGVVLAHPKYAYLLEYYGKTAYINRKNFYDVVNDFNNIIESSNLEMLKKTLSSQNIDSIIITEEMKEVYWHGKETRLLLLLKNTKTFIKVYDNNSTQVYKINLAD